MALQRIAFCIVATAFFFKHPAFVLGLRGGLYEKVEEEEEWRLAKEQ